MVEILRAIGITIIMMLVLSTDTLGVKEGIILVILLAIFMEYVWKNTPDDKKD